MWLEQILGWGAIVLGFIIIGILFFALLPFQFAWFAFGIMIGATFIGG